MTDDQRQLLDDIADFLEDQADGEFFTDAGRPKPSTATKLLTQLYSLFPDVRASR